MKILSQMFSGWHDILIGKSTETIGRKGCLITCISMITDYIGQYLNPGELAHTLDFTPNALLIWASVTKVKLDFVYRYYQRDDVKIKKAFKNPDQFIVLQVNNNHWVWLIGISGGYKVADPYYQDIIYLSKRRYKITGFAVLEKQDEDEWTENDQPNEENPDIAGQGVDFLGLESGTKFLDLSHWNVVEDLSKVKSAGYKGIIHKCTQGISNKDSKYIENKKRIKELEFAFGAYHYANAGDPIQEAEWFLKNTGELQNGDIIVLDYETYAREDADDWCLRWMDYVYKKTGKKPILYTYHGMLNKYKFTKVAKSYKLWAARYGLQEQEPNEYYKPATGAFQKAWAWQYCSVGSVPGINKRVDLNIIY